MDCKEKLSETARWRITSPPRLATPKPMLAEADGQSWDDFIHYNSLFDELALFGDLDKTGAR